MFVELLTELCAHLLKSDSGIFIYDLFISIILLICSLHEHYLDLFCVLCVYARCFLSMPAINTILRHKCGDDSRNKNGFPVSKTSAESFLQNISAYLEMLLQLQ